MRLTQCSNPPELSEDSLYAVIDGLGNDETVEHLANCLYCSKRLTALQRFDSDLEAQLARFECPTSQELTFYYLNQLVTQASAEIAQHVKECPRCQQELEMLEHFLSNTADEIEPMGLAHKIISVPRHLWRAAHVEISGNLALKGLSGSKDKNTYDVKAGTASVFLEMQTLANSILLTGQVIDGQVDWRGALAEMHQAGTVHVLTLDELCEFRFELTETTPIDLYITALDGIVLAVEQLTISP